MGQMPWVLILLGTGQLPILEIVASVAAAREGAHAQRDDECFLAAVAGPSSFAFAAFVVAETRVGDVAAVGRMVAAMDVAVVARC